MTYKALYRTYRPRKFADLIGQEHIVRTLRNSIRQQRIGHAYLFSGPRGTGKTTVARILARAINCEKTVDGEPCDNCPRCKGSDEGLGVIEIDAASHGSVDDMRMLVAQANQIPLSGGMMVYIIDEVHMLSKEAFNAFLKTLEEPPPHAVFVLATTEPGKLLATIHSRCQHFSFRRIPLKDVAEHLGWICREEKVPAEDAALRLIARAGDGSVRDSISVLEQAIAFEPDGLTLDGVRNVLGIPDRMDIRKLAGYIVSGEPGELSSAFAGLIQTGREPNLILTALMGHFRDLLFASLNLEHSDLDLLPEEERKIVESQASGLSVREIHGVISSLAKCENDIKWEEDAALLIEVHLLRLALKMGQGAAEEEVREEKREAKRSSKPAEILTETRPAVQEKPPERKSLTGGLSLKKKKAEEAAEVEEIAKPEAPIAARSAPKKKVGLAIPEGVEPFWRDTLESIREISPSAYILLAETIPSPQPSEWKKPDKDSAEPLKLTLIFQSGNALVAKLTAQQSVTEILASRLKDALERPVEITIKLEKDSGETGEKPKREGMLDGEGPVPGASSPGGPTLFQGATRPAPSDPDLADIHNLIVKDFPEYKVEYFGDAT